MVIRIRARQCVVRPIIQAHYVCESCDLELYADVESYGAATLPAAVSADEDVADAAMANAEEHAVDTLAFVPCPACSHRSSLRVDVLWSHAFRFIWRLFIVLLLLFVMGLHWAAFLPWAVLAFGGMVLIVAIYVAGFAVSSPWVGAVDRTAFSEELVPRDPGARPPSDVRRQEVDEAREMRRKVSHALAFSLAVGAVVAAVII